VTISLLLQAGLMLTFHFKKDIVAAKDSSGSSV
jgi:hypothetical protein